MVATVPVGPELVVLVPAEPVVRQLLETPTRALAEPAATAVRAETPSPVMRMP